MFHDQVLSKAADARAGVQGHTESDATVEDRRTGSRVPFPAELLMVWHHDLGSVMRYRIIDAGDGGFRISSALPLLEGMTGMALKLLPDGKPIDQPVMVVWIQQRADASGYEVGLRCF